MRQPRTPIARDPRDTIPGSASFPERDVPVWLVLVIFVWIEATWDSFAWTFLGPSAVSWKVTRIPSQAIIQGVPQGAVAIGLTLGTMAWLGWWKGAGLRSPTSLSPVSLALLLPTAAMAAVSGWRASIEGVGPALMLAMLVYYTVQPATEELLYRGFLLHGLTRRLGSFGAVAVSSGLFALAHFVPWGWPPTARSFSLLFGFGVVTCAMRMATGSIWYPIVFHGLYNLMSRPYSWIDHPVPEYAVLWYVRRSIGVVGVMAMVLWLGWLALQALAGWMLRWMSPPTWPAPRPKAGQPTRTVPRIP